MKRENKIKTGERKRVTVVVNTKDYDTLLSHLTALGKPFAVWVRERIDAYLRRHNLKRGKNKNENEKTQPTQTI